MPGVTTLPDELIDLLAEMYGEVNPATKKRWTLRQLAVWASAQAGREVTRPVVERAIKPVRAERAQMAREVARERIARELPAQLDTLDTMIGALATDFSDAKTPGARRDALDAYQKGLALKLRYSGLGEAIEVSGAMDVTSDGKPIAAMTTDELVAHVAALRTRIETPGPG